MLARLAAATMVFAVAQPLPASNGKRDAAQDYVEGRGFNCPKLISGVDEGEGPRGRVARMNCSSLDGKSSWGLRLIKPPKPGSETIVEPVN